MDDLRCPTHGMKLCPACATVRLPYERYRALVAAEVEAAELRAALEVAERQVRHVERMRDEMVGKRNRVIAGLKQQRKYLVEHRDDVNGDAQVKARYRALKHRQRNTRAMLEMQVAKTKQQRAKTGRVGNAAYAARIAALTYEYQNLDQAATILVLEAQRDAAEQDAERARQLVRRLTCYFDAFDVAHDIQAKGDVELSNLLVEIDLARAGRAPGADGTGDTSG